MASCGIRADASSDTELRELEALYAQEDAERDAIAASEQRTKDSHLSAKTFVKVGRDLRRRQ